MTKVVFTHRFNSQYNDYPEKWYHFPSTYLKAAERSVGDWVLYYEPRRGNGRLSYFATALLKSIEPDPVVNDHYYAIVTDFIDFSRPVPLNENGLFRESAAVKEDGSANRGTLGRAVRNIPDQEFDAILKAGLTTDPLELGISQSPETVDGFSEVGTTFERPLVHQLISRKFRDHAFARNVKIAYQNRCALSGLSLTNGGGRPEVEAAHIVPVASNGPDTVRNGLALSGTLHWMFDRGVVSIDEDFSILVAEHKAPKDSIDRLIVPGRKLIVPKDERLRPSQDYLRFHREAVFAG